MHRVEIHWLKRSQGPVEEGMFVAIDPKKYCLRMPRPVQDILGNPRYVKMGVVEKPPMVCLQKANQEDEYTFRVTGKNLISCGQLLTYAYTLISGRIEGRFEAFYEEADGILYVDLKKPCNEEEKEVSPYSSVTIGDHRLDAALGHKE